MSKVKSRRGNAAVADLNALRGPAVRASSAQSRPAPGPSAPGAASGPAPQATPAANPPDSSVPAGNRQPVNFNAWPDNEPARWVINYSLETLGLLHLGSGEDSLPDNPKPAGTSAADGAAVATDTGSGSAGQVEPIAFIAAMWQADSAGSLHAWLPGSSLKGSLLARAKACAPAFDKGLRHRLFGRERQAAEINEASPLTTVAGVAEFLGAVGPAAAAASGQPAQPDAAAPPPPRPPPPFEIETRTAIDRATLTVADGKLFQEQTLPPGSRFDARIVLPNARKADAKALCALLQGIDGESPLVLGAHGRAGWGRVKQAALSLRVLGQAQAKLWWGQAATGQAITGWESFAANCTLPATPIRPQASTLRLPLTLNFEGPFAVRDPAYKKIERGAKDSQARARNGRPLLPATSLLGALRSQAERILRTLGAVVPQGHAAPAVRSGDRPADLASLLFGCAGWRGLVGASGDFVGTAEAKLMTQHMVALCRITGTAGGTAGAKFAFECWESPVLKGELCFDRDRFDQLKDKPQWLAALGLLHLVLADLAYGDIGFGMARSKGWGWIKEDETLLCRLETDWWAVLADARLAGGGQPSIHQDLLQALHLHTCYTPPEQHSLPMPANVPHPASPAAEEHPPTLFRRTRKVDEEFHNPYHFLPFAELQPAAEDTSRHSHDRWHTGCRSGHLTVTLETVTPLYIGGELRLSDIRNQPNQSNPFTYGKDDWRAIPGTSLRGMLSSLLEPMSGSAMRVIDADRTLSVRMPAEAGRGLPKHGVVYMAGDDEGRYLAVTDDDDKYKGWGIHEDAEAMLHALADERWQAKGEKLNLTPPHGADAPKLYVATKDRRDRQGQFDPTKKGQVDLLPAIDFDGVDESRLDLRNPDANQWGTRARLTPGQKVWYRLDNNNEHVAEIAWSGLFRKSHWVKGVADPGPLTVKRLMMVSGEGHRLPLGLRGDNQQLHAAEWLLGVVEQRPKSGVSTEGTATAFASKLSVGMALAKQRPMTGPTVTLKELSSPKPPSPSLYLRPHSGKQTPTSKMALIDNPTGFLFQGTKAYLHALRKDNNTVHLSSLGYAADVKEPPWQSQRRAHEISNRQITVTPIKAGESFTFTIRFTNLSTDELAMLCAALQPSDAFRHKLGMGRPIGLGSVKLTIDRLQVIDRNKRLGDGSEAHKDLSPAELAAMGMASLRGRDEHLWRALLLLGEPDRIRHPVHYPQVDGQAIETENYKWWKANDKLQALIPLDEPPQTPEPGQRPPGAHRQN